VIDANGFRYNIGIILVNQQRQVLLAKRVGQDAWQFPQGGINSDEKIKDALLRELYEEIGLEHSVVKIIGQTKHWLRYKVPYNFTRDKSVSGIVKPGEPEFVGQKQRWYLLKFMGDDAQINLNISSKPEFDGWQWVSYWYPLRKVIFFKRGVYRRALAELSPLFWQDHARRNSINSLDHLLT